MAPLYTASTNNTFYLSTDMLGFAHAEADCNLMGGHLASYSSRQEQVGRCCTAGPGSSQSAWVVLIRQHPACLCSEAARLVLAWWSLDLTAPD